MIYIFLAHGFEEIEAIVPRDVLKKAHINIATISIDKTVVESKNRVRYDDK